MGVEQVSRQAGEVAQGLAQGRWVVGDPTVNENYIVFGDPIYAVGPGRVVSILTDLPENTPPTPPPASNPQTILGNHIIQDLGGGRFALYAHMQPNSIPAGIHLGSRLQWGQVIGRVGNAGNSTAPHLHLHVTDGPDAIASDGWPYVWRHGVAAAARVAGGRRMGSAAPRAALAAQRHRTA